MTQREFVSAYIGLGANLGDARQAIFDAVNALKQLPLTQVRDCSSLYRSEPVAAKGPDFFNAVVHLQTQLNPIDLLRACQQIENRAGRERPYPNAPRTLDLDVLLFGTASVQSSELCVPHPRMRERAFVLLPLHELAPHLVQEAELLKVKGQAIQNSSDKNWHKKFINL